MILHDGKAIKSTNFVANTRLLRDDLFFSVDAQFFNLSDFLAYTSEQVLDGWYPGYVISGLHTFWDSSGALKVGIKSGIAIDFKGYYYSNINKD